MPTIDLADRDRQTRHAVHNGGDEILMVWDGQAHIANLHPSQSAEFYYDPDTYWRGDGQPRGWRALLAKLDQTEGK